MANRAHDDNMRSMRARAISTFASMLWLAACGSATATTEPATTPPRATPASEPAADAPATEPPSAPPSADAEIWRPASPPAALPRFPFRIALANADGTTGAYLVLDESAHFFDQIASGPAPTEREWVVGPDFVLRRPSDGRVAFSLRPSDGELRGEGDDVARGSRPAQDLHCHLTPDAHLACIHEDGQQSPSYAVEGGHIIGWVTDHPEERVVMNAVEPAPTTDAERRLVLFVWAAYVVPSDTDSHDGDAGFF